MEIPEMKYKINDILKTAWWFVPVCLTAGVINGLLGAGGGVIMLYALSYLLRKRGGNDAGKDAFASVVAVILPVSLISALSYATRGNLDMTKMQVLIIPAIVGGVVGAYLTDKLPTKVIRGIFAVLVIISGVRMVW